VEAVPIEIVAEEQHGVGRVLAVLSCHLSRYGELAFEVLRKRTVTPAGVSRGEDRHLRVEGLMGGRGSGAAFCSQGEQGCGE
jgi:hypothetical protein